MKRQSAAITRAVGGKYKGEELVMEGVRAENSKAATL